MKHFNKLFGTLAVILVIYDLILGGYDFGRHNYQAGVPNLIIGFFWAMLLGFLVVDRIHSAVSKVEMEFLDKMSELITGLETGKKAAQDKREEFEHDSEMLTAIIRDRFPKTPPTEKDLPQIADWFHQETDRYVKLFTGASGMDVEFSSQPFEEAAKQPESSRRIIPVIDGDEPAKKSPTKSQQRRINTRNGLGPLTDDEVREVKNAKRREARAAKKAADTTTIITQPGQTKLV